MNTPITPKNIIDSNKIMDVRTIPCSIKHGLIIDAFRELAVGDHFILVNGHDPVPLYYQFAAEWPGTFTWEHVRREPEDFHVKITKVKALEQAGAASACGCSGH